MSHNPDDLVRAVFSGRGKKLMQMTGEDARALAAMVAADARAIAAAPGRLRLGQQRTDALVTAMWKTMGWKDPSACDRSAEENKRIVGGLGILAVLAGLGAGAVSLAGGGALALALGAASIGAGILLIRRGADWPERDRHCPGNYRDDYLVPLARMVEEAELEAGQGAAEIEGADAVLVRAEKALREGRLSDPDSFVPEFERNRRQKLGRCAPA